MSKSEQDPDALVELFARFMRNSMHSAIIHSRECGLSMPQLSTLMILRKKQVSAISEIAEELGVNKNTLHTWISKHHGPQKQKSGQVEDQHVYDELKRLRKENKRLTEERDILKKAAAYFAKESL